MRIVHYYLKYRSSVKQISVHSRHLLSILFVCKYVRKYSPWLINIWILPKAAVHFEAVIKLHSFKAVATPVYRSHYNSNILSSGIPFFSSQVNNCH